MNRIGWLALAAMLLATILSVREAWLNRGVVEIPLFPKNIAAITALVEATQVRLTIVADYCAYGSYSDPQGFGKYKTALEARADAGIQVQLTIYRDDISRQVCLKQFGLDQDAPTNQKTFSTVRNTEPFKAYFKYHAAELSAREPTTPEDFIQVIQEEELDCIRALREKKITVDTTIDRELPVFMWIKDNEEAIVSIYNFGPSAREASLRTKNRSIVNVLSNRAQAR